jgi:hypothetical protein
MHDEFIALAIREFDYPLDPDQRQVLADHLATCDACRDEVIMLRDAHLALRSWGSEQAPSPVSAPPQPVPASARWWPSLIAATLAGVLIGAAGGFSLGRQGTPEPSPAIAADGRAEFTLLLEEPAGSWPPVAPEMRQGYVDWRDSLSARGLFATGDRFSSDGGWYVATNGSAQPAEAMASVPRGMVNYSGYFVIRAQNYDEAVAIARTSPHLQFGGILVRRTF